MIVPDYYENLQTHQPNSLLHVSMLSKGTKRKLFLEKAWLFPLSERILSASGIFIYTSFPKGLSICSFFPTESVNILC